MFDLIIRGADMLDGTGAPPRRADVAVTCGVIVAVEPAGDAETLGPLFRARGRECIDAAGLTLAPGFVDVHSHADIALLADRAHARKLAQGVTTEVFSNCGIGFAPVTDAALAAMRSLFGALFSLDDGVVWQWRSVADYLGLLASQGIGPNVLYLTPHGALRMSAMGMASRASGDMELATMQRSLCAALTDGASGLSTGPGYAPMDGAEEREFVALARQAGLVAIHQRSYREDLLECTKNTVRLAKLSGARWQLSHLQTSGPRAAGLGERVIELLDDARANGIDIACDMYPYTAGSTVLTAILPAWITDGGPEATLARLADPESAARLDVDLEALDRYWPSMVLLSANHPRNQEHIGKSFPEIAAQRRESIGGMVRSLLVEENLQACYLVHHMQEADLRAILSWPHTMIGSDGLHLRGRSHPRLAGAFARWLGCYARDPGLVTMPEAVRRITSLPAEQFGLAGRGRIAKGYAADLVLFRAETVCDRATYDDPDAAPDGVPFVWVNGEAVKYNGCMRMPLSGRVLRRSAEMDGV